MSKIIKKVELYYRNENDNLVSDLSSIESFCGHNSSGDRFVGVYIHTGDEEGGAFHLFDSLFPIEFFEIACFKYDDYTKKTLLDLENTLKEHIDATFTLDEVADDLSIFARFLNGGC